MTDSIPEELKALKQWVLWSYEDRSGKPTKTPKQTNGWNASSNDPSTWSSWANVEEYEKIGFVFSANDTYCGLDLDNAIDKDGKIKPWALEILTAVNSYAEISPSGRGIKIYCKATLPIHNDKTGGSGRNIAIPNDTLPGEKQSAIELWDHGKFFAMTGAMMGTQTMIVEAQQAVDAILAKYSPSPVKVKKETPSPASPCAPWANAYGGQPISLSDSELIDKAKSARNGSKFTSLWGGDISAYASHSEADEALCYMLAFWCGNDESRIDTLFKSSGLYTTKWDRPDYSYRTIRNAISHTSQFYQPSKPKDDDVTFPKSEPEPEPEPDSKTATPPEATPPGEPRKPRYKVWTMKEITESTEIVDYAPVIDGLLRRGEVMNVVAGSKTRKSWFILGLTMCLEYGLKLFDRFLCSKCKVLVIDNELHLPTIRQRSKAVCEATGLQSAQNIHVLPVRGKPFGLGDIKQYIQY